MQILDMTIANVALPHMQTSLGAAQDTITWVLTSYIVAAAIATPITGWLSDNIGRKRAVPDLRRRLRRRPRRCAAPPSASRRWSLFRILQGAFGAALAPLSQSVHHGHQPARAAGPGDGDLGRRHHGRADHRPDHRRLAHRQFQLALVLLHQRAGRHRSPSSASLLFMPDTVAAHPPLRFLRLRHAVARRRLVPVHARPRRSSSTGSTRRRS